jgi:DNA polymerase
MSEPKSRGPSEPADEEEIAKRMARAGSLAAFNRLMAKAAPMVKGGIRPVPGEGPLHARVAFVGEQPGDREDRAGKPFVGPAGRLLDKALEEAGLARGQVYVTNAVKHFKFVQRGKRRLHAKPNAGEVKRYRGWLEKELDLVGPKLVVALGGTAALALAGRPMTIAKSRGPVLFGARAGYLTIHPSFLLRMPQEDKADAFRAFVKDMAAIRKLAQTADPLRAISSGGREGSGPL